LSRHKMKLAIVTRSFPPDVTSGRETVIYNLWRQAGQQDDVALISGWRYSPRHLPPGAMLVDQSSASRVVNYARFFFSSAMLVRHLRPDVVLSNAIELGPVASPSAVIAYDLNFGRADSRLRGFTHVVAISQTTANQLVALGMRHGQVSVILNGVDLDRFRPLPAAGGDRLTVVYPSRIVHGKGQHVAIEALRRLDETLLARTKLVIVGYVDDSRYLEQIKAATIGLPVEIHTNVGDIAPYYQSADVVVFPTVMEEGFGYTAAEALACGKPVIHSDYPAIREATGGVGVPVPVGDAAALAQAMASLLRDPERRDALGRAGRIHAEAHYDWAGVYRQYRQVLGGLILGRQER
jgi:glycosyltransferase involved in cell wall biosynthesis